MHTHVFNARDLPLKGIFASRGAPAPIGDLLAVILLRSMKNQTAPRYDLPMEEMMRPNVELSPGERESLMAYVGATQRELVENARNLGVSQNDVLVAETSAKIGFPPDGHRSHRFVLPKVRLKFPLPILAGYVRFFGIRNSVYVSDTGEATRIGSAIRRTIRNKEAMPSGNMAIQLYSFA
jgi:hypothetical protein